MGAIFRNIQAPASHVSLPSGLINGLITRIGTDGFGEQVVDIVREELGADICGAYSRGDENPSCLFAGAVENADPVRTAASRYTRELTPKPTRAIRPC